MHLPSYINAVSVVEPADINRAHALAALLSLPIHDLDPDFPQLVLTPQHLEIRAPNLGNPIYIDFSAGKNAHRRQFGGGRGQPLARAVGFKTIPSPTIIDATAGFGRDAYVLASLGAHVTLIERNPILAALLTDAIDRARQITELSAEMARMTVINHDASHYLQQLDTGHRPDVIYMDPMYPSREKSALVKKEMQLLHQLIGPDTDSHKLLEIARKVACKRVVVKRPKSAPHIAQQQPSAIIESKNTRYDLYYC